MKDIKTVRLVLVPLEIRERGALLLRGGPMDSRQLVRIELFADSSRFGMANLERQRDRFSDRVIGRQQMISEPEILERPKTSTTRVW